ncbi:MAG: hypothetical protein P8P40_02550 [Sulfitobacter sp.]|jgi:hypothetical protein|nr:hypothetical protein [Sulfitobacter sp.]
MGEGDRMPKARQDAPIARRKGAVFRQIVCVLSVINWKKHLIKVLIGPTGFYDVGTCAKPSPVFIRKNHKQISDKTPEQIFRRVIECNVLAARKMPLLFDLMMTSRQSQ